MVIVATLLATAAFVAAFALVGVAPAARGALRLTGDAFSVMGDATLSDEAKEKAVQRAAIGLLGAAGSILVRFFLALAAAGAPILALDALGLASAARTIDFMARWDVILGLSAALIAGWLVWSRLRRTRRAAAAAVDGAANDAEGPGDYALGDRLVHALAFAGPGVQRAAADLEDRLFSASWAEASAARPIFIASLPRAGTTVLLNALNELPQIATHLYRDMPFITAPVMWARLSRRFRREAAAVERAHGDGLTIGFDSPEAFEEVIWRAFRPEKYVAERLALWTAEDADADADADAELTAFLRTHMRKIVALRCGDAMAAGRYVSKNNGSMARLALLPAMFPDARIVTPLRDPFDHVESLLRQHRNFTALHDRDAFARRYMNDIGHLEFGSLLKPIDFGGLTTLTEGLTPDDRAWWLGYWIAAFEHVRDHRDTLILFAHESATADPGPALARLCAALDLDLTPARNAAVARYRATSRPPARWTPVDDREAALVDRAAALHAALAARAI